MGFFEKKNQQYAYTRGECYIIPRNDDKSMLNLKILYNVYMLLFTVFEVFFSVVSYLQCKCYETCNIDYRYDNCHDTPNINTVSMMIR